MGHSLPSLSPTEREQVAQWLSENHARLPAPVCRALAQHDALVQALSGSDRRLRQLCRSLRVALGIVPKSERRSSGDPLGPTSGGDAKRPQTKREKLEARIERLGRLSDWHQDVGRRQKERMSRLQDKLDVLPVEELQKIELSPEVQAEIKENSADLMQSYALGDGKNPVFERSVETLMTGSEVSTWERTVPLEAPEVGPDQKLLDQRVEERVRYDFSLTVTRVVAEVEKKVVVEPDGTRRVLSASTQTLGPARFAVTWGFLSNLAVLVGQYGMPIHRMGRLLSSSDKKFTSTSLSRMLRYVAFRLLPIYLQLADELADSEVLHGDDTPAKVLDVQRYFKQDKPEDPPPWDPYRTPEAARKTLQQTEDNPPLGARLATELGFEFPRRAGKGSKTSLHTTGVSGRSDPLDPRSLIVFYRTHLGGLGNLLEVLLSKRHPHKRGLFVQSDLATVNLVTDPELLKRFDITYVGCASHARRPFAVHQAEDENLAQYMLNFFKGIFIHEHGLDIFGRNEKNVSTVRDRHTRRTWEDIRELAEIMSRKWSPETKLGQASRYILRHYDKLTAYLEDPRLEPTNNFSERMLRMEKVIESGSMFRATLNGRYVLDILRTVLQTAVAAGAPLQEYVFSILTTPAEVLEANPELYTPRAWTRRHLDDPQGEGLPDLD